MRLSKYNRQVERVGWGVGLGRDVKTKKKERIRGRRGEKGNEGGMEGGKERTKNAHCNGRGGRGGAGKAEEWATGWLPLSGGVQRSLSP